jgi:hypothetical protein
MAWQDFEGMTGIPPTLLEDALRTAVENGLEMLLAWNPYAALEEGEENWEFFPAGAEDLSIHSRVLFSIGPKGQLRRVTPKATG